MSIGNILSPSTWLPLAIVLLSPVAVHAEIVLTPRADAVFSLLVPQNNYGSIEDIHLYAWTQDGQLNVNRVLLAFDLSDFLNGAEIEQARLILRYNLESRYRPQWQPECINDAEDCGLIRIERVTQPWNEMEVNWANQPSTDSRPRKIPAKVEGPQMSFDLTPLIRDIQHDPLNSYGFMLRYEDEAPYKINLFASRDHPDPQLRPKLVLTTRSDKAAAVDSRRDRKRRCAGASIGCLLRVW